MSDDQTQKDLHLIYAISVEDIKFAKQQQWRITYYTLILMASIFYLRTYYQLHYFCDIFLLIATPLIAFVALYILIKIESDMLNYRSKIVQVNDSLSDEFININQISKKYLKTCNIFNISIPLHKCEFLLIQIITISIAAILLSIIAPTIKG